MRIGKSKWLEGWRGVKITNDIRLLPRKDFLLFIVLWRESLRVIGIIGG